MFNFVKLLLVSFVISVSACSEEKPSNTTAGTALSINPEINTLSLSIISYAAMAYLCKDNERYLLLKNRAVKVLEFGNSNNLLTNIGTLYYNDLTMMVEELAKKVKGNQYITCGETRKYADSLIEITSHPKFFEELLTK